MHHNPQRTPTAARLALQVNGEAQQMKAGATLADLIKVLGLAERRLAVAVNRRVVPRAQHRLCALADGDRVEILEAVGGG